MLKHDVEYRTQVLFELFQLNFVGSFIKILKQFNHLYNDIKIILGNILQILTKFGTEVENLHEKIINYFTQLLQIILKQKIFFGLRNNNK